MSNERNGAVVPASERAVVGLCHDLNDQLAAVSAYVFMLKRRGALGQMEEPIQEHLDRLAHGVRMLRSLARGHEPHVGPVSVSLLAEAVTDVMRSHPDGPVRAVVGDAEDGAAVVRCDWNTAIRCLLEAASWVRRGIDAAVLADVEMRPGPTPNSVSVSLTAPPADRDDGSDPGVCTDPASVVRTGPSEALVLLTGPAEGGIPRGEPGLPPGEPGVPSGR